MCRGKSEAMRLEQPIYLDNMATTPIDERVAEIMQQCMTQQGVFANASSEHAFAYAAQEIIANARTQVAAAVGAHSDDIIWTSGATEANNLAIQGAAHAYAKRGKHIVTCATEHKAVLDCCAYLETQGFSVTYLQPQVNGLINLAELQTALQADTSLLSLMHVNNETGVIQDIAAITKIAHTNNTLVHVDAAQSVGKVAVDVSQWNADLVSFAAHKCYGPKGIGALYLRSKLRLQAIQYGGGQERSLRPGTLANHQIVGMGAAFALAKQLLASEVAQIAALRDRLWQGLADLPGLTQNGDSQQRVAHNLNISVAGVDGQALRIALRDIALSSGSACSATAIEPSHVLLAMGVCATLAHSSLRFSLGRFTTAAMIEQTIERVREEISRLRALSPLWPQEHANVA